MFWKPAKRVYHEEEKGLGELKRLYLLMDTGKHSHKESKAEAQSRTGVSGGMFEIDGVRFLWRRPGRGF